MAQDEYSDLLAWLAETPVMAARALEASPEAEYRRRGPGETFSLVEQVCHLRDIETDGYSVRIDRILTEDNPSLADVDGSRLAVERDYQSQDAAAALAAFTATRSANLARLRGLSSDQFKRTGELEGSGQITLGRLLQMMREHDTVHRGEIDALTSAIPA